MSVNFNNPFVSSINQVGGYKGGTETGVVSGTSRSYAIGNNRGDKYAKYDTIKSPSYENHEYLAQKFDSNKWLEY